MTVVCVWGGGGGGGFFMCKIFLVKQFYSVLEFCRKAPICRLLVSHQPPASISNLSAGAIISIAHAC